MDTELSAKIEKRGRPPELLAQAKAAEKLAQRIQSAVRSGLGDIAFRYPDLIKAALDMALSGDKQMLKLMIELPTRFLPETNDTDSPFQQIMEQITLRRTTTLNVPSADNAVDNAVEGVVREL